MDNILVDDLRSNNVYDFRIISGIGHRETQQDSAYIAINDNTVFVVLCDGMGGMQNGDIASKTAIEAMTEYFSCFAFDNEGLYDPFWMQNAIEAVDDIVYRVTDSEGKRVAAGTTLVTAVITDNKIYWASVGDSRIYIVRESEILQITQDHIYEKELRDQLSNKEITQAYFEKEWKTREALTSYVGMGGLMYLDLYENGLQLEKGDFLLFCSDGFYKTIPEDQVLSIIRNYKDLSNISTSMENTIIQKEVRNQDNYTLILVKREM